MSTQDLTIDAVSRFLLTVLFVDESWGDESGEDVGPLVSPGLGGSGLDGGPSDDREQQVFPVEVPLSVTEVVDAFASAGLFATPFKPEDVPAEDLIDKIERIALRADVVVLDWHLYGDDGERSIAIAQRLADGLDNEQRTRLVVFYTGRELDHVEAKLQEELGSISFDDGVSASEGLRIVVLAKAGSSAIPPDHPRIVTEQDLPKKVIELFAQEMSGILPTVALAGLSAVRENTQRILSKFDSSLDPGFLGHRSLLHDPEEAADQLPGLLADEIRAVLEDSDAAAAARIGNVKNWLEERAAEYEKLPERYNLGTNKSGLSWLVALHSLGFPAKDNNAWHGRQKPAAAAVTDLKRKPALFHSSTADKSADDRWALLMAMRGHYGAKAPLLHLGVILASSAEPSRYFVCLRPVCDSVRLEEPTDFHLAELSGDVSGPVAIVMHGDRWIQLRLPGSLDHTVSYRFKPKDGVVRAQGGEGHWVFSSTGGVELEWLGEFKPAHAQRLIQQVASSMSRVGLDESEWVRRLART